MERLLDPDPDLRITVEEALQHPWIAAAPAAAAHQVRLTMASCSKVVVNLHLLHTAHTHACVGGKAVLRVAATEGQQPCHALLCTS
jgi:hypothetical protein